MRNGLTDPASDSGKPQMQNSVVLSEAETIVRLTEYLSQIRDILHEITPLQSRWNGVVQLDPTLEGRANAMFLQGGTIVAAPRLIYRKARWRTLIHEMIHSLGVPMSREDYEQNKGWEEGFVEYAQRRLRPLVMTRLGIAYDETFIQSLEPTWMFQSYVQAAETIIEATGEDGLALCYDLLREHISSRSPLLIRRFRSHALLISKQSAALRHKIQDDTMNADLEALWNQEEP